MENWALPLLEVSSLLLFGWCLADAWRRGARYVVELLAGSMFGVVVEQVAIIMSGAAGRADAYGYGPFAWMATPDVPFVIALSWGALLYAAIKYSDALGIPLWMRPAADALYALMLDLTMDVVAVRMGLWHWATNSDAQWFGVPYSNYGGWLLLALLFSIGVRALRSMAPRASIPLHALLSAAMVGLLTVVMMKVAVRLFTGSEQDAWAVGILASLAAAVLAGGLLWRRRASRAELAAVLTDAPPIPPWPDPALVLPLFWHLSYLGIALLTGIFRGQMTLLFLTGVMAGAGSLLAVGLTRQQD